MSSYLTVTKLMSSAQSSAQFVIIFETKRQARLGMSGGSFKETDGRTWAAISRQAKDKDHDDTESDEAGEGCSSQVFGSAAGAAPGDGQGRDCEQTAGFQALDVDTGALAFSRKRALSTHRKERNSKSRKVDAMLRDTALEAGRLNIRTIETLTGVASREGELLRKDDRFMCRKGRG